MFSNWSSQFPDVYGLLLWEQGMLHSGKHGPVPIFFFWEVLLPSNSRWANISHEKVKCLTLNTLLRSMFLRSMLKTISVYEICKSLHVVFDLHFSVSPAIWEWVSLKHSGSSLNHWLTLHLNRVDYSCSYKCRFSLSKQRFAVSCFLMLTISWSYNLTDIISNLLLFPLLTK